jgi:hypothetical protein
MTTERTKSQRKSPREHADEPKKYRDRPADEGKHGDEADEPNSGVPTAPHKPPEASRAACSYRLAARDRHPRFPARIGDFEVPAQIYTRRRPH